MKIIIIGAGPAGMAAALTAKNDKNEIILLEKNDRVGKKLLATGNGRCNYSNMDLKASDYNDPSFVKPLLEQFQTDDLIQFFQMMGLESTREGHRIYPITLKANSVLNTLLSELERKEIEVVTNCHVTDIFSEKKFIIKTNKGKYTADKVVVATGGCSMPVSGSDGKSFQWIQSLGHSVTKLYPALTQLKLDSPYLKHLSGVKVQGEVKLFCDKKLIDRRQGDLLFTNYGISGPPILDLSVYLSQYDHLTLELPLINNITTDIKERLCNRYYVLSHFSLEEFLMGIVDKKFIHFIVDSLHLSRDLTMSMMEMKDFNRLIHCLLHTEFSIIGTTGFKNSQVTRGGVVTEDICAKNFSSKLVSGLFIIGEALNVDGVCGGYNLHFAFGSGIQAGKALR
ncbi:MAG: aminoacetone oxidase family FAD-binding enzyme [Tissierellia bacterium]|nr:aminoacetone oxidase family FAD-binding enzyme [Tissierellia bacterium]